MTGKDNRKDQAVRYAMWTCHNYKCFYSGQYLSCNEMVLDHIIPQYLERNPERLKEALRAVGKDENFDIHSLYNLVPCKPPENRRKGVTFTPITAMHYLAAAEKLVPKIEKEIENFRKDINFDKNIAAAKSDIGDKKLEDVYDFLADEQESFEELREVTICLNGSRYYHHAKKNILLSSYLPSYPDIRGSCLVAFRTLKIRGCAIALSHQTILSTLFQGLNTDLSLGLRGFMVCPDSNDSKNYYVRLGGNQFKISVEVAAQLCDIIDDFAKEYIDAIQILENKLGTCAFKPSKAEGGFRLIRIKRGLWRQILQFANEFEYDKGNSSWHIFDANPGMLKIYTPTANERVEQGYHVILYPEQVDEFQSFESFRYPDNEMWIVWKPLHSLQGDSLDNFNERKIWDAMSTYKWLTTDLIPYVIYYYSQKRQRNFILSLFKRQSFKNFMKKFDSKDYINFSFYNDNLNIDEVLNISDLSKFVNNIQNFYSIPNIFFFKEYELRALYSAVYLCLKHTPRDNYRYIREKLSFTNEETLENILQDIEFYKLTVKSGCISSCKIDDALRCLAGTLSFFKSYLNEHEIQLIVKYLEPFAKFCKIDYFVKKYQGI